MKYPTLSHFLTFRRLVSLLLGSVLCAGHLACGISGGSIPPGRSAGLKGRVISSESPGTPLPNILVLVEATPDSGISTVYQTRSDANGYFSLTNLPTGERYSSVTVTVKPDAANLRAETVMFRIPTDHTATMIAAVTNTATNVSPVGSVSISPQRVTVNPGDVVHFTPVYRDTTGQILNLPLAATLVLPDDVGTLQSDGTFTATSSGAVNLIAYWYNASYGTASVNVEATGTLTPPPPPDTKMAPIK